MRRSRKTPQHDAVVRTRRLCPPTRPAFVTLADAPLVLSSLLLLASPRRLTRADTTTERAPPSRERVVDPDRAVGFAERASTVRPAHTRQGRRRSVSATTRSRLGSRSASLVSALIEPSRRCDEESGRRGDVTRRTAAHTAARTCVGGTSGACTTRSAALANGNAGGTERPSSSRLTPSGLPPYRWLMTAEPQIQPPITLR